MTAGLTSRFFPFAFEDSASSPPSDSEAAAAEGGTGVLRTSSSSSATSERSRLSRSRGDSLSLSSAIVYSSVEGNLRLAVFVSTISHIPD